MTLFSIFSFVFFVVSGTEFHRYGEYIDPDPAKAWLIRTDGSLFSGKIEKFTENKWLFSTETFGILEFSDSEVSSIIFIPPVDPRLGDLWSDPTIFPVSKSIGKTSTLLVNEDVLEADFGSCSGNATVLNIEGEDIAIPNNRIRYLRFFTEKEKDRKTTILLQVEDGSRLKVQKIEQKNENEIECHLQERTITVPAEKIRFFYALDENSTFVSNFPVKFGDCSKDRTPEKTALRIGEKLYPKGISTKNGLAVTFELSDFSGVLYGSIGLEKTLEKPIILDRTEATALKKWRFSILCGDETLFRSDPVSPEDAPIKISVELKNCDELTFLSESDSPDEDHHAVWGDLSIR